MVEKELFMASIVATVVYDSSVSLDAIRERAATLLIDGLVTAEPKCCWAVDVTKQRPEIHTFRVQDWQMDQAVESKVRAAIEVEFDRFTGGRTL